MKPSDRLALARIYIIEHGLARGELEDKDTGEVCSLGALRAVGQHDLDGFETDCLAQAIEEINDNHWASSFVCVSQFSDTHTEGQVIDEINDNHWASSFVCVSQFSDTHTEGQVIDRFDRAVILAKEAED